MLRSDWGLTFYVSGQEKPLGHLSRDLKEVNDKSHKHLREISKQNS